MSSSKLKWIERRSGVWEVICSNPVGDSDFFFVPHSWHADHFIFTKKTYVSSVKPSEVFCFKGKMSFAALLYFLSGRQLKIPAGKCDNCTRMMQMNPPDDWLKKGWALDSQTRARLVDSLLCMTCSLENNGFSVLHHVIKVALHYTLCQIDSRFILPWKFRAQLY